MGWLGFDQAVLVSWLGCSCQGRYYLRSKLRVVSNKAARAVPHLSQTAHEILITLRAYSECVNLAFLL
jgi:hypothetical protein